MTVSLGGNVLYRVRSPSASALLRRRALGGGLLGFLHPRASLLKRISATLAPP